MRTTALHFAFLCTLAVGATAQTAAPSAPAAPAAPATNVPVTKNAEAAASGVEVGIARRDGITYSDGDTYVTRNGIMEKLVKELELPSGVKVAPDGTITMPDKTQVRLRGDQIVTLAGVLQPVPSVPTAVIPVAPAARQQPAANSTTSPTGNAAPSRDTSQATITGSGPAPVPDRVGGGSAAK